MTARIRPGTAREVGVLTRVLASLSGVATGTRPPKLFLVLGKHRRLFRGWLRFASRLMPGGVLPRRETELVILRVALLRDSRYEFEQHRRIGRRAGLRAADIERVTVGADADGFSDRERVLLRATDQLHADRDLDDATWDAVRDHLDERGAIELCLLVGHYEMLATTINALRISPDESRRRCPGGRWFGGSGSSR